MTECWLAGSRVRVGEDVLLSWRPLPGYAPVTLEKRLFAVAPERNGVIVRPANADDMAAIRGLYALTGGRAALMPLRIGLWQAPDALTAEIDGRVAAYCRGSAADGVWHIHEWGMLPDVDVAGAASAFAAYRGCRGYAIRAEFAPPGGEALAGERVYVSVPKPFLLGTQWIENAEQLAKRIAVRG